MNHPWLFLRYNWREIIKFLLVGSANYLVDVASYNFFRSWILEDYPVFAKVISVFIATIFSWLLNRNWTFSGKATKTLSKEVALFAIVNLAGMTPSLICIWISHYVLGFTSRLADNISGNIIGLIIGTVLRYFCYRSLVFTGGQQTKNDGDASIK